MPFVSELVEAARPLAVAADDEVDELDDEIGCAKIVLLFLLLLLLLILSFLLRFKNI